MKVYVITSGEYSDYRICAVTLDKEKAEELKKRCDHFYYTGAEIEEYETDECEAIITDCVYRVEFDKSGTCIFAGETELTSFAMDMLREKPWVRNKVMIFYVIAKSKEAAVKIAAERRAKHLAEKIGL